MNITIVYHADPAGVIPGGIDTCIKGIIRYAPEDFRFSILGVTTDPKARPVRRWTTCELHGRPYRFYPLLTWDNPGQQPRFPITLRLMASLFQHIPRYPIDLLQFHRIEPALCFRRHCLPKVTFIHQDMTEIENKSADIRWKYAPWLYYRWEDFMLPRFDRVYVVHEGAVRRYRSRYVESADRFQFMATWADPELFYPVEPAARRLLRERLAAPWGIPTDAPLLLWVGRIDRQKDPLLLLDAFSRIAGARPNARLILLGDGVLRKPLEVAIRERQLSNRVLLLGLQPLAHVADWMRIADLLVLSSAYEGMPCCVMEAMGCGTPAVSTDVGEVRRLIQPGHNGEIAEHRSPEALGEAISMALDHIEIYRGRPCLRATQAYTPDELLKPVYEHYRCLVDEHRHAAAPPRP